MQLMQLLGFQIGRCLLFPNLLRSTAHKDSFLDIKRVISLKRISPHKSGSSPHNPNHYRIALCSCLWSSRPIASADGEMNSGVHNLRASLCTYKLHVYIYIPIIVIIVCTSMYHLFGRTGRTRHIHSDQVGYLFFDSSAAVENDWTSRMLSKNDMTPCSSLHTPMTRHRIWMDLGGPNWRQKIVAGSSQ